MAKYTAGARGVLAGIFGVGMLSAVFLVTFFVWPDRMVKPQYMKDDPPVACNDGDYIGSYAPALMTARLDQMISKRQYERICIKEEPASQAWRLYARKWPDSQWYDE